MPRLRLIRGSRGRREVSRKPARPGRGRAALAGAEEKLLGCRVAPAVAGLRQLEWEGEQTGVRSGSGPPAGWSPGLHPAGSCRRETSCRAARGLAPPTCGSALGPLVR